MIPTPDLDARCNDEWRQWCRLVLLSNVTSEELAAWSNEDLRKKICEEWDSQALELKGLRAALLALRDEMQAVAEDDHNHVILQGHAETFAERLTALLEAK